MRTFAQMEQELIIPQTEYDLLLSRIDNVWRSARANAASAVNSQLIDANWNTGRYIVEFELKGNHRAEYGKQLLLKLSRDLTASRGKGFSRSNLTYMKKLYLAFPKCETLSHKLTWSHYFELLKSDDPMEFKFYFKEYVDIIW